MTPVSRLGVGLALLGLAGSAHAGSPVFNRPGLGSVPGVTPNPTSLSGTGTAVAYATHDFTAASNGTYKDAGVGVYQITTTIDSGYATPATSPNGTSNFVQVLYAPTFDPKNPLQNAVLAYSQGGTTGSYTAALADGTDTLVNTGYYNSNQTGGKLSVGTTTTTISQENFGTTSFVPDFDPTVSTQTGVSQTLTLYGSALVTSLNSFSFVGLQSNSVGFLAATLTHDGKTVNLFNNPATGTVGALASFDGSQTYKFADSGQDLAAAANDAVNAAGPFDTVFPVPGGTFQSLDPLSAFDGTTLGGDWTLNVMDSTSSDNATFLGFSFNADTALKTGQDYSTHVVDPFLVPVDQYTVTTTPVPEASSTVGMSLACLALAALGVKRRRTAPSRERLPN